MKKRKWYEPRWWERKFVWKWLGALIGVLVLATLAIPFFSGVAPIGMLTEVRMKGNQLFNVCKLYAYDRDDRWPERFEELREGNYFEETGWEPFELSERFSPDMMKGEVWKLLVPGMAVRELRGETPVLLSGVEFREGRRVVVFANGGVRTLTREELGELGIREKEGEAE